MSRSRKRFPQWSCPGGKGCGVCGPRAKHTRYLQREGDDLRLAAEDLQDVINFPYYPWLFPED